ncbi:MAG: hypothetical protein Q9207_008217, partial [Kuettlingeria erythrocarpa]
MLPEISPDREIQVVYDNSLPEAFFADQAEHISDLPPGEATRVDKLRRKVVLLVFLFLVLIAVGLGIGLSFGWRRRGDDGSKASSNSSDAANVTLTQSPATNLDKHHSVMDNTSITVVTLPNSNRQIYFQERTGALRRAVYSSQARVWQASADVRFNPGTKNNTPLAGVVGLGDGKSPAN